MHLTVLGSGSGGNSALISFGNTRILVDAGLSAGQLQSRLQAIGTDPDTITAILLTHEHGDHVRGLDVLTKKFPVPIYCNALTRQVVRESFKSTHERSWKVVQSGQKFCIGEIEVECFPVPHDAVDPMGFIFRSPDHCLGLLTDLGHVTRNIRDRLKGLHTLFVEANYDGTLLQNDTKRPFSTKQRISSQHGHLSNHQTCELVSEIAHAELERIVLGHLSSDCNTAELASKPVRQALEARGLSEVHVHCASQNEPTGALPVRLRKPAGSLPMISVEREIPPAKSAVSPSPALSLNVPLVQAELF